MKKILLGTTALVAASFVAAPGAQAAEKIKLGLGGFMWQTVGYASQDGNFETATGNTYQEWDQKQASEIHFVGSTKLDNGISVAARVEMEAAGNTDANAGNDIDTAEMTISSATLGSLRLGKGKGVAWTMGHRGVNYSGTTDNAGDHVTGNWIVTPNNFAISGGSDLRFTGLGDVADIHRVSYMTPRFMGFGAGISVTNDTGNASATAQPANTGSKTSAVIAYDETIDGIKVGADLSWANQSIADNTGYTGYNFGASLGYAGFTLSGSWNRLIQTNATTDIVQNHGYMWDIGLGYKTGPYSVSAYYTKKEAEGTATDTDNDEEKTFIIGGAYNLGPGVDLKGSVFSVDYSGEDTGNANNNDGWGVSAGMYLTF
jgi:outer membrane protein OmpU